MTSEQCRSIIQQAAEAWIKGNADSFASLFLPDGEFIVIFLLSMTTYGNITNLYTIGWGVGY